MAIAVVKNDSIVLAKGYGGARAREAGACVPPSPVNVSHLLAGEYVGLEEVADGEWDVHFGPLWLGRFQARLMRIVDPGG